MRVIRDTKTANHSDNKLLAALWWLATIVAIGLLMVLDKPIETPLTKTAPRCGWIRWLVPIALTVATVCIAVADWSLISPAIVLIGIFATLVWSYVFELPEQFVYSTKLGSRINQRFVDNTLPDYVYHNRVEDFSLKLKNWNIRVAVIFAALVAISLALVAYVMFH